VSHLVGKRNKLIVAFLLMSYPLYMIGTVKGRSGTVNGSKRKLQEDRVDM